MTTEQVINNYPEIKELYHLDRGAGYIEYFEHDLERITNECRFSKLNGYDVESIIKDNSRTKLAKCEGLIQAMFDECDEKIEIGTGATIILWSDTRACTVTEIQYTKAGKPKRIGVRHNEYQHVGGYYEGRDCNILPALYGDTEYYTLRKNGGWYAEGQPKKFGSVRLAVGYQRTYIDPSF